MYAKLTRLSPFLDSVLGVSPQPSRSPTRRSSLTLPRFLVRRVSSTTSFKDHFQKEETVLVHHPETLSSPLEPLIWDFNQRVSLQVQFELEVES